MGLEGCQKIICSNNRRTFSKFDEITDPGRSIKSNSENDAKSHYNQITENQRK